MTTPDAVIETVNDHLVAMNGTGGVAIMMPPMGYMSKEEAIRLAAWLVVCAEDYDAARFGKVFEAVCNT